MVFVGASSLRVFWVATSRLEASQSVFVSPRVEVELIVGLELEE